MDNLPPLNDPNMVLVHQIDMSLAAKNHECEFVINTATREASCECGKGFRVLPHTGNMVGEFWISGEKKVKIKSLISPSSGIINYDNKI